VRASSGGYCLEVGPDEVDALRFGTLRRAAAAEPDHGRARVLLAEALGLWHDPVLGGVRDLPFAGPAAARLAGARAAAAEELAARGLADGVPDAGRDTLTEVLGHRRPGQRRRARARSGRGDLRPVGVRRGRRRAGR
jgi:hypothetical protein